MKLKIKDLRKYTTSKDGQALLDRQSRPYTRVTIKTDQHGDKWLSGFAYSNSPILNWKVGDDVEVDVVQNGNYLNFRLPKPNIANDSFVIAELKALRAIVEETHRAVMELVVEPALPDGGPEGSDLEKEELPDMPF